VVHVGAVATASRLQTPLGAVVAGWALVATAFAWGATIADAMPAAAAPARQAAHGEVSLSYRSGEVVVRTSRAFRRHHRHDTLKVRCRLEGTLDHGVLTDRLWTLVDTPVPRVDVLGNVTRPDYCLVALVTHGPRRVVRRVGIRAFTSRGRRILALRDALALMSVATVVAGRLASRDRYPTSSAIVQRIGPVAIALPEAEAKVPRGRLGVYSDGAGVLALVAVTPAGDRCFVISRGPPSGQLLSGTVETNILSVILTEQADQVDFYDRPD